MLRTLSIWVLVAGFCAASSALHAQTVYNVTLSGDQEFPGPGDPDGAGSGTVTLDPTADTISWNINYSNLTGQAMSGFHIHGPLDLPIVPQSKPIFVFLDLIQPLGPLPNGNLTGVLTDVIDPSDLSTKIDQILAEPHRYYLNIHTSHIGTTGQGGYPAGAIRGALPEPAGLALMAVGSLGLLIRRRRV